MPQTMKIRRFRCSAYLLEFSCYIISCVIGWNAYLLLLNGEPVAVQKFYIRIIFLIPNYAISSFLSLTFSENALYIETVRDMCVPAPTGQWVFYAILQRSTNQIDRTQDFL